MRTLVIGLAAAAIATQAGAALPVGARAPDFVTDGALGGKPFKLHLQDELKKGPVVLYFYPAAFTEGCTLEAHAFSAAAAQFRKAGAEVIGMSRDELPKLKLFSVKDCRNQFAVATASEQTARAYDVFSAKHPQYTNRTSYVIARDGRIVMVHDDPDWSQHVARTLAAVRSLKH